MNFVFRAVVVSLAAAAFLPACNLNEPVERVCPAMPEVEFTPTSQKGYGVKDNLLVTIRPFGQEDGEKFSCPATVCFTLDGSDPERGRAATHCMAAPVKNIPIKRSTCIKYFVEGVDGTQSIAKQECYRVEPPPVSYCDPKSKSSKDPVTVSLVSNKAGTIFYTMDGSDPDPYGENPETLSGAAPEVEVKLDFEGSTTIKFRAQDADGNLEEKVNTCEYKVDLTAPLTTVSPDGSAANHTASGNVTVTLEADELASIYYTLDGSQPSPSRLEESGLGSTQMEFASAQLTLSKSTVLNVYAIDLVGNEETPVQQHVYIIGGVPALALSKGAGPYQENEIEVEISAFPAAGTAIRYTTNGTDPLCPPSAGTTYATPITAFNQPGDYTLKYRACYGSSNATAGPIQTANYVLGASGRPYPVLIDFNDVSQYDALGSSKAIEHNTHMGYIRTRPKIPQQTAAYDGVNSAPVVGNPNLPYWDLPEDIFIDNTYLFYAAGNSMRIYTLGAVSPSGSNNFPQDAPGFTTPYCSTSKMNGLLLGIKVFPDGSGISAITPWTDRGIVNWGNQDINCGGFARWSLNLGGSSTLAYSKGGVSQFAGTQNDPFLTDIEEVSTDHPPTLPKTDFELSLNAGLGEYVAYMPHYNGSGYELRAYYAMTGNTAITAATAPAFDGRPTAVKMGLAGAYLAIGDSVGNIYTVDANTLAKVDTVAVPCPAGSNCRVNGIAWYTDNTFRTFLLVAMGYYGDTRSGQIAIVEVSALADLTLVSSAALPNTDPFVIASSVEGIGLLNDGDHAVAALREQGIVVLDLEDAADGKVASRGYVSGSDVADNAFWASDVSPYPAIVAENGAAVVDSGRNLGGTSMDGGFRLFKFADIDKFETAGYYQSTNLNASPNGVKLGRAKLVATVPSVLPPGIKITWVTDNVHLEDDFATVGNTITFPDPASDLRVRVTFASPNSGATSLDVQSLKLELTPVE